MMDIVMLVAGAGVGAMLRDLFVLHRGDISKTRQQLESKTPYDYALTNARADNERYRDELRTIQALKRTEADTERIRNEIDTILSDDVEEATESVYGGLNGIPIVRHSDGTISPFPRWDGMSAAEAGWDAAAVSRAYANANVREDDTKDEQLTGDEVECSLTKAVRDSFENKECIRVFWEDPLGRLSAQYGIVSSLMKSGGEVKEFTILRDEIFAKDVVEIKRGRYTGSKTLYRKEDDINGETLY